MLEKIKNFVIPYSISLGCIVTGWYISILNVGLNRFKEDVLFTKWTVGGLILIIIGSFIPTIWRKLKGTGE